MRSNSRAARAMIAFLVVLLAAPVLGADEAFRAGPGGMRLKDLQVGQGVMAERGMVATIHFIGWLDENGARGREIYNSRSEGRPVSFVIGTDGVMPGWNEGLLGLSGIIALFALLALAACDEDGKPVKGFVLPQGDIAQGEQVFVDFNCYGCHTVPGIEFPKTDFEPPFILEIGGEVYRVRTYGELLTAVVNPDHIISPRYKAMLERADREVIISPMPYYGEQMTVAELIDLVEFLHAQYTKLQPEYYRGYYLTQ